MIKRLNTDLFNCRYFLDRVLQIVSTILNTLMVLNMDKIVIMTDAPDGKSPLAESLRVMFPGCEVEYVSKKDVRAANFPEDPIQENEPYKA